MKTLSQFFCESEDELFDYGYHYLTYKEYQRLCNEELVLPATYYSDCEGCFTSTDMLDVNYEKKYILENLKKGYDERKFDDGPFNK